MGIKYTTAFNRIDDLKQNAKELNGASISVGVMTGDHQWLASIHEYG